MNHFILKKRLTLSGNGGSKPAQQTPPPPNVSQYPSVLAPPQFSDLNLINSFSYAEIIDLLGDGPIEGLVNNNDKKVYDDNIFEGIYLNDTAVKETSSDRNYDIPIFLLRNELKNHWLYDGTSKNNFLTKDVYRKTIIKSDKLANENFPRDVSITSYHPRNSILEFVKSFNGSFDAIALIQRAFDLSPIKNESPFLTKINIPLLKVNLPVNIFDSSEGGDLGEFPIKLKMTNISDYIYFSIGPDSLTSFNYFEIPRSFIDNNSFLASGKKTVKKNLISSSNNFFTYEIYDINFYIWSIYNNDLGIKNIDNILDKYFNKITFYQNSKSLFNFNLIQSELKTGSEVQSPLKYFSTVQIDTEYNKELIGPYKVTNSWTPKSALDAGGVQRLINFTPKNYLIDSSVNIKIEEETSDDIRYVKSWPVTYDNRNRPYLICCATANYSNFDKTTCSRVSQPEIPIVHYIENDNVEQVYVTLNVQELYDTNHIDLESDNSKLGIIDNKYRQDFQQTDTAPSNVNTYGNIIGYNNAGFSISGSISFLIYGNCYNDGYVLDGFKRTGVLSPQKSIDGECLFCNLRRVLNKNLPNTLYYKVRSNDELNYLIPNLNSYILDSPTGYLATKENNLVNYLIPNDSSVVTESFCYKNITAQNLQAKLKTLNDDGSSLYCFGLSQNEIITSIDTYSWCNMSSDTIALCNQLNSAATNCKFYISTVSYLTFQAQSSNLIVGTVINNLINWSLIFNKWTSNQVLSTDLSFKDGVSFEIYPNIFKFIINPFISEMKLRKAPSLSTYYTLNDTSIIGNLYLVGIHSSYLSSQSDFFNDSSKLYLNLNILDSLLEQFLLTNFDSSNFSKLNTSNQKVDIFDSSLISAFKNKISFFENGRLLGNSSILSFTKIPITSTISSADSFNSILKNGSTLSYDINKIYLYKKANPLISTSLYINNINGTIYSYDVIFQYNLYINSQLSNLSTPNSSVQYRVGTERSEQGQDPSIGNQTSVPNLALAKQSITAGTKLPSIIVVDIETGLELNENRSIRGSCEYFCYRYNIFGLSTGSSYIDIGRKSSDSVQGYKRSSDTASYALNIPNIIVHNNIKLYLIKLKLNENGLIKEKTFLTNHKGFYFGDIDLYDVDLSIRNHPSMSYIYNEENKNIGIQQRWYRDTQFGIPNNIGQQMSWIYDRFVSDASKMELSNNDSITYFDEASKQFQLLSSISLLKSKNLIPQEFFISSSVIDSKGSAANKGLNYDTYRLYSYLTSAQGNSPSYITDDDVLEQGYFIEAKIYNFEFSAYETITDNATDNKNISAPYIFSSKFYDKKLNKNRSYDHLLWSPGTSVFEWNLRKQLNSWYTRYLPNTSVTEDILKFEIISLKGFIILTYWQKQVGVGGIYPRAASFDLILDYDKIMGLRPTDIYADANNNICTTNYSNNTAILNDFYLQVQGNAGEITSRLRIKDFIGKNIVIKSLIENPETLGMTYAPGSFQQTSIGLEDTTSYNPTQLSTNYWYLKTSTQEDSSKTPPNQTLLYKVFMSSVAPVVNNVMNYNSKYGSTVKWLTVGKDSYITSQTYDMAYAKNLSVNFWTAYDTQTKKFIIFYNSSRPPDYKENWGRQLEEDINGIFLPAYPIKLAWMKADNTIGSVYTPPLSFYICKNGGIYTDTNTDPYTYSWNPSQQWAFWFNSSAIGPGGVGRCLAKDAGNIYQNMNNSFDLRYGNYTPKDSWCSNRWQILSSVDSDGYRYPENYVSCFDFVNSVAYIGPHWARGASLPLYYIQSVSYPKAFYEQINLFFADGVNCSQWGNQPATTFKTRILDDYSPPSWSSNFAYYICTNVNALDYCDIMKLVEKRFLESNSISSDVRMISYEVSPTLSRHFDKNNLIINYFYNVPMSNVIGSLNFLDSGLNIQIPKATKDTNGNKIRRYVKITRKSHEILSPLIAKRITLNKVTEIIPQRFSYPFSSIIGTKIDSRSFSSIPTRTFHCKLKKILVPSNYFIYDENENDIRYNKNSNNKKIYIGDWDGSFKLSWSNNPAWILMDLLINKRYGLGNYVESEQIDIWELYKISRWCDGVDDFGSYFGVDDGYGGVEPRHTFNAIISEKFNIFDMINQVASVFRGRVYYMNSLITFDDDRLKPIIGIFNNTDVKDGLFNYTNHKKDDEYSAVDVSYIDSKDNYKPKIEYVEDSDGIRQRGLLKKQINAFGITSKGQARRYGKHFLFQVSKENSNVTFTTDMRALLYKPGDLIKINDEIYNSVKNFGVVKSIKPIDKYSFKVVIDKILDDSLYASDEITLYTPISKPKYDDFYSKAQKVPEFVNVTMASPLLGITNSEIIYINNAKYTKTSQQPEYTFKMIPYDDINTIKSFSGISKITYNLLKSLDNSKSLISIDVTGFLRYNENSNINNEPSKYGHWEFSTGYLNSKNSDKLLFDILNDESLKFESSIKNYFFTYFDTGRYLKITGLDEFSDPLYQSTSFDPKDKKIKFNNAWRDGSFYFEVQNYKDPSISYYDIIENNKPTVETFYITGYTTGNYIINDEVQNEFSELYVTRSGKNSSNFSKIKDSVSDFELNNLHIGSPYSLNIKNKKDKTFKIMSILENYINEYNIFATEYNIDKFKEIEENSSIDDMRNTFNYLNAYNQAKILENKDQLLSPVISSIKHVRYNISSNVEDFIEVKWNKVINAGSFNIYLQTPSKQTSNFKLNVSASEFNSEQNTYIKLIPLNKTNLEVGTYVVSIEAVFSNAILIDNTFRSSALSTMSISILYY